MKMIKKIVMSECNDDERNQKGHTYFEIWNTSIWVWAFMIQIRRETFGV